jgi:hypothetical protein
MPLTNFPNGILGLNPMSYGVPFKKGQKIFYVDPQNGNDSDPGTDKDKPLATLIQAHSNATANNHDTVFYIAGSSGLNMTAALDWSKSYTHLIGVGAPTRTAQRTRIFQLSTLTGASPLFTVSASGCIWHNIYIFQGVNDATSLINVSVTGGRNYFSNIHFAGGGHAAQAIDGGASLKLDDAEENTFRHCTIGVDTIDAATGMVGLLFDDEARRNEFHDCKFRMKAGNAGAAFVEVADATALDRDNQFFNTTFTNNSATSMTEAFVVPAGMAVPRGPILLDPNCWAYGVDDWESNDRGVVKIAGGTFTAGGNTNIYGASTAA